MTPKLHLYHVPNRKTVNFTQAGGSLLVMHLRLRSRKNADLERSDHVILQNIISRNFNILHGECALLRFCSTYRIASPAEHPTRFSKVASAIEIASWVQEKRHMPAEGAQVSTRTQSATPSSVNSSEQTRGASRACVDGSMAQVTSQLLQKGFPFKLLLA